MYIYCINLLTIYHVIVVSEKFNEVSRLMLQLRYVEMSLQLHICPNDICSSLIHLSLRRLIIIQSYFELLPYPIHIDSLEVVTV